MKAMEKHENPLSFLNIFAGVLIAVVGGVILAFIIQEGRFAPTPTPTSIIQATAIVTTQNQSSQPTSVPTAKNTSTPAPSNSPTPTKTSVPTMAPVKPSDTPVPVSSGAVFFGRSKNINGLVVSVGPPDYDSGCSGTLDFEVTLSNETDNPIVLSFGLGDIKLLGNGEKQLSLYGDYGAATPRCYGGFKLEVLAPNSTVKFAVRTTDSLGSYSYLDLVFGEKAGRLAGEKWRLDLSAAFNITRTPFGQDVNIDGLEATVGDENYFPGCKGTLDFQIVLRNTTSQPIILSMGSDNLKLYGDSGSDLSVYSQFDNQSTDCYGGFKLETMQAGETVLIAVRNISSLSGLSYVDFVFEADNRLDGLRWRLTLPR